MDDISTNILSFFEGQSEAVNLIWNHEDSNSAEYISALKLSLKGVEYLKSLEGVNKFGFVKFYTNASRKSLFDHIYV